MNTSELIAAIDEEIDRLMQVRKLLFTGGSIQTGGRRRKRHLSAEARARIAAAQRKRWAAKKRAGQR